MKKLRNWKQGKQNTEKENMWESDLNGPLYIIILVIEIFS